MLLQQSVTPQTTSIQGEVPAILEQQLTDAENLVKELKHLLVKHETTLDEEGIREQLEIVERWAESYRRGLRAATKLSAQGQSLLTEVRDRLKLSADELTRMEDEGPATGSSHSKKAEDFIKVSRKIEEVLPAVVQVHTQGEADRAKEEV